MAATIETRRSGSITWEVRTSHWQSRRNGKCRVCKKMHSVLVDRESRETYRSDSIKRVSSTSTTTYNGQPWRHDSVTCCGKPVEMKAVKGTKVPEIPCGAKCLSSKGHVCECSCGGKNHGAGWA